MEKSNSLIELGEEHDDLEIEFLLRGCKTAEQLRRRKRLTRQFNEELRCELTGEQPDEIG